MNSGCHRQCSSVAFVGTSQAHRALKIRRALEFNVGADRVRQAAGEELELLKWGQGPNVCHPGLEHLLVTPPRSPGTAGAPS
jgi:hypothetical protein